MKIPKIVSAMENIDDDLIAQACSYKPKKVRHINFKSFAAAAACIVIAAVSLITSEASSGSISNLLAPVFRVPRTEIIDDIGHPVGVEVSKDGYTLKVEAVVGDSHNAAVVYSFTRDDGQPIGENVYFKNWDTKVNSNSSGGGSMEAFPDKENLSRIYFIEKWNYERALLGRYVDASFSDLSYTDSKNEEVIAKGPWEVRYTLRYKDPSIKLDADKMLVTDASQRKYRIDKVKLSYVGLHIEGIYFDPSMDETDPLKDFKAALRKKDGTSIEFDDINKGYSFADGDDKARFHYEVLFPEPVLPSELDFVVVCNKEISVND